MSTANLSVNYDGPALEMGEMEIADLAPALMGLGKLFEEANRVINGENSQMSVRVIAGFKKGSFEIELHLVQGWIAYARDILAGPNVTALTNLCSLLGISGGSFFGFFKLLKFAKGRQPKNARTLKDGNIELIFPADRPGDEDDEIVIDPQTLNLFRSLKVRKAAEQAIKPLSREGIDSISLRPAASPKDAANVVVHKSDLASFQVPEVADSLIVRSTAEVAYSIVNLSFSEDGKWKLSDGQNVVWATIDDTDFLDRVDKNQVAFSKGDILLCDVVVRQWQTDTGLKIDTHIVKVKSHRHPSMRQIDLPFGSP